MKVGIVIFPSKKLQDIANSFRKRYDPKYSLIPPHLTLKAAFDSNEDELAKISKELEKISKNFKPFELKTLKISTFHPVTNAIYLKVEPTEELEGLFDQINSSFFGTPPEYAFVPHITIGQQLSNSEHADVYGQLSLQKVEHSEIIDRFHLLYQLDNGVWTVYETFLLGK